MIRDDNLVEEVLFIQALIDTVKTFHRDSHVVTLENPSYKALDYFTEKGYKVEAVPIDDYYTNDDYYNIRW